MESQRNVSHPATTASQPPLSSSHHHRNLFHLSESLSSTGLVASSTLLAPHLSFLSRECSRISFITYPLFNLAAANVMDLSLPSMRSCGSRPGTGKQRAGLKGNEGGDAPSCGDHSLEITNSQGSLGPVECIKCIGKEEAHVGFNSSQSSNETNGKSSTLCTKID